VISRSDSPQFGAFTLVEMIVGMGVFGIFSAAVAIVWVALQASAVNTAAYARRQNDQMRVVDYVKRDLRRATSVQIYNGVTLVSGTSPGTELRVVLPDYYADTREEDNLLGTNTPNAPALAGTNVSYGATTTVRYYVSGGAVIRNEGGRLRTLGDADGAFVLSFRRETNGEIRSTVTYTQPMRRSSRVLRRQLEILSLPRTDLQL
jgi:prepilin-type N-terminal cleavage/methylation domain-containing protein